MAGTFSAAICQFAPEYVPLTAPPPPRTSQHLHLQGKVHTHREGSSFLRVDFISRLGETMRREPLPRGPTPAYSPRALAPARRRVTLAALELQFHFRLVLKIDEFHSGPPPFPSASQGSGCRRTADHSIPLALGIYQLSVQSSSRTHHFSARR